jgi:hypothetical protein
MVASSNPRLGCDGRTSRASRMAPAQVPRSAPPLAWKRPQLVQPGRALHQLEERRALAAGQDERAQPVQVGQPAHLAHVRAQPAEDTRVGGEVALKGEDADRFHQPRSCKRSPAGMAATSSPRMGSPRPREASATVRGSAWWVVALTIARARRRGRTT